MPPKQQKQFLFDKGVVNNPDFALLREGEMSQASGCEYRLGAGELFIQPGRTYTDPVNPLAVSLDAIYRARYELATDVMCVYGTDGNIYESTVGTTAVINTTPALTGLTANTRGQFTSFGDRHILCNGADAPQIREPENVPGTSSPWRSLALQRPMGQTTATYITSAAAVAGRPGSESGSGFTSPTNAYDTDTDTYALAQTALGGGEINSQSLLLEYYDPNATSPAWVAFSSTGGSGTRTVTAAIEDGSFIDVNGQTDEDLQVRATLTVNYFVYTGAPNNPYIEQTLTKTTTWRFTVDVATTSRSVQVVYETATELAKIFDIKVIGSGSSTSQEVINGVQYFVTQRYSDSEGVSHESEATEASTNLGPEAAAYGATVDLPTATESFISEFVIYRTLDTTDGAFPVGYEVGTAAPDATTWVDDFSLSLTSAADKNGLIYPTVSVTFVEGTATTVPLNSPPPVAKMAVPFDGSIVYVPINKNTIQYSLPTTITIAAAAQVPTVYYLEFLTGRNDTVQSVAVTNGGRQMAVFFNDYTMLVNSLPLALGGSVFDNRIREYLSEKRGAAGTFCSTTFTTENQGRSIAAAVDALGLWITDGNTVRNWSDDFDWSGEFAAVDHMNSTLTDNPEMRRLELIYQRAGAWYELHFFYGRTKENGQPLITGPHPATTRTKHYANVSGTWVGWSGDSTSAGRLYTERQGTLDFSNAYASDSGITFIAESGDMYPSGIGRASNVVFTFPKFGSTAPNVLLDTTLTYSKDSSSVGGNSHSKTKSFTPGINKKQLWLRYADRFRYLINCATREGMPPLIAVELTVKDEGASRNFQ